MDWGSSVLSLLASASLRVLIFAAVAWLLLRAGRTRLEPARHAIWTVVLFGMLLAIPAALLLPAVPLRVLGAPPAAAIVSANADVGQDGILRGDCQSPRGPSATRPAGCQPAPLRNPVERRISWQQVVALLYALAACGLLLRLAIGHRSLRKLVRQSRKTDLAAHAPVYESDSIAVPMTAGWIHPKIFLPRDWRTWRPGNLAAVLAHEGAHVERADWAIAALAAFNRSLFWFHPLAWWLERTLARLAEEACDDSALRQAQDRGQYAQVLLDMAAAVRLQRCRTVLQTTAMAKASEVRMRIDRILDETRTMALPWNRRRWAALLTCSVPVLCALSVLQLAPARAIEQESSAPAALAKQRPVGQAPAAAAPLTLRVNHAGTDLLLTWNPDSAAIRGASHASLSISDGERHENYEMGPAQLRTGSLVYSPLSKDVRFKMEVVDKDQRRTATETLRLVAQNPAPQHNTSSVAKPQPVRVVTPEYPPAALVTGVHGTVRLTITVDKDGKVTDVTSASGHPTLIPAAVDAVRKWRYEPQSQELHLQVEVPFAEPSSATINPPSDRGQIEMATLISRKEPEYPLLARQMGAGGTVELIVTVGADGSVKAVKVVKGHPLLIKAAQDAVMQWRYRPTLLNGTPVQNDTRVTLNFVAPKLPDLSAEPPAASPFRPAMLIHRIEPQPPSDLAGTVHLWARIGTDGRVSDASIEDGDPTLASAALQAVRQWVYSPAQRNGEPVESETRITFQFPGKQ